jgi:hypothetical protein
MDGNLDSNQINALQISAVSVALERATDVNLDSKNLDPQFQLRGAARAARARAARLRKSRPPPPFYERKPSSAGSSSHKEEPDGEEGLDEERLVSDSDTEEAVEVQQGDIKPPSGLQPMYVFILCFSLSHCPSGVTRDWFSSLYSFIGSLVDDYDLIHGKAKSKHANTYLVIGRGERPKYKGHNSIRLRKRLSVKHP